MTLDYTLGLYIQDLLSLFEVPTDDATVFTGKQHLNTIDSDIDFPSIDANLSNSSLTGVMAFSFTDDMDSSVGDDDVDDYFRYYFVGHA